MSAYYVRCGICLRMQAADKPHHHTFWQQLIAALARRPK